MGKAITNNMIQSSYDFSRKVYHNQLELNKALNEINNRTGMDRGSANAYVHVFSQMMQGKEYRRTMNTAATSHFLSKIRDDYGIDQLKIALNAVKQHTEYYSKQGKGSLRSIEKLVEDFHLVN
jgi:hypothetical protein